MVLFTPLVVQLSAVAKRDSGACEGAGLGAAAGTGAQDRAGGTSSDPQRAEHRAGSDLLGSRAVVPGNSTQLLKIQSSEIQIPESSTINCIK